MKRVLGLVLLVCIIISFCSCSEGTSPATPSNTLQSTEPLPAGTEESAVPNTSTVIETDEAQISSNATIVPDTTAYSTAPSELETEPPTELATAPATEPSQQETDLLTPQQRNSINMLNYMTVLAQNVNEAKGNQLYLESAYASLVNDIFPNSVDTKTQAQITTLMDTIKDYRMIDVKRARLEFIYEQNRAQAMRKAIPNPVGLLSAVQSGSYLKAAASVIYMAVDSVSSYQAATSQADLQFIKDGWELDDAETEALHNSTKNALTYMFNMVRDYNLPGDYALNKESVEAFVSWSGKPGSQNTSKIKWFEDHESTYRQFGPYWLELAKDYYEAGKNGTNGSNSVEYYMKCLEAIAQYEAISTRIFRKDIDYAKSLPMAIIAAKETMEQSEYIQTAKRFCELIMSNTKDADWELRYFAAQTYLDLYALSKDTAYIDAAYSIVYQNVNQLVDEQRSLNATYLAEYKEVEPKKDATSRQKDEIKSYNKAMKAAREIALPPVSEALYLNCDLLFALAEEKGISNTEKAQIEAILHEDGKRLFLTKALDDRFWFTRNTTPLLASNITVEFDGDELTIPAVCVTDRSVISVTVTSSGARTGWADWIVTEVERPSDSDSDGFIVTYESETGDDYDYEVGDVITIKVIPVEEDPENCFVFTFNAVRGKILFVSAGIDFERVN